jgi:hypothetical protein
MPPKKEKKEIKKIFEPSEDRPWWQYHIYSKEDQ